MDALARVARDARLICLNAGIVGALGAPWELRPTMGRCSRSTSAA